MQDVPGEALLLARPLNGVDTILSDLRLVLLLSAARWYRAGRGPRAMASRRVLAPLGEVAEVAQDIGETDDLTKRLHIHADDEVGQLATTSTRCSSPRDLAGRAGRVGRAQRQLVADASHELRTPVTSLRTNVEVCSRAASSTPRTAGACSPTWWSSQRS